MPNEVNDPRVYFAAERTLLAWVRTGITVIGMGFVVARFGMFLRMMRHAEHVPTHTGSTIVGVALVVLGSLAIGMAAWQHVRFIRVLAPHELPRSYFASWSVWFSWILMLAGFVLAVYLLMRADIH